MTENKPRMTVYVSDTDMIPREVIEEVIRMDGFTHSAKKRMYEFTITTVGISHEYQLDNSDMDFECMLDHICDVDLDELAHEPLRRVSLEEHHKNEYGRTVLELTVHKFTYYAPNSTIEVRYLQEL
jgi:hypothetical protein